MYTFMVSEEKRATDDEGVEELKQQAFAATFGSIDPDGALKRYREIFEKSEEERIEGQIEEFIPETEADVQEMLNVARRAGVIN